jgi:hypothetical protein
MAESVSGNVNREQNLIHIVRIQRLVNTPRKEVRNASGELCFKVGIEKARMDGKDDRLAVEKT